MRKIIKCVIISMILLIVLVTGKTNNVYALSTSENGTLNVENKDIEVSSKLTKVVGSYVDHTSYTNVQGFCTDGTYFYVAALTKDTKGHSGDHKGQNTRLLKIKISDMSLVKNKAMGEIGHCNGMTYNPNTDKIIISTCVADAEYVWTVSTDLEKKSKLTVDGLSSGASSISYSIGRDEYIVRRGVSSFAILKKDGKKLKKVETIKMSSNMVSDSSKILNQDVFVDSAYIYCIYATYTKNSAGNKIYANHISIYDYNGIKIKDVAIPKATLQISSTKERVELEGMCKVDGKFYLLGNVRVDGAKTKMRIYKMKEFKNTEVYDVVKVNFRNVKELESYNISAKEDNNNILNEYKSIEYSEDGSKSSELGIIDFSLEGYVFNGYRAFKDKNNTWRVRVYEDESNYTKQWLTEKEIKELKANGIKYEYCLYKDTSKIYHTTTGGNTVLMVANWEKQSEITEQFDEE